MHDWYTGLFTDQYLCASVYLLLQCKYIHKVTESGINFDIHQVMKSGKKIMISQLSHIKKTRPKYCFTRLSFKRPQK